MRKPYEYDEIQQIMAEADEILQQIDPDVIEYMEEERRIQLRQQAQSLKRLKIVVQEKTGNEETPKSSSYGEGVHEAIEDIVKAMKGLTSYLS